MDVLPDGLAVQAVRALLASQGVPADLPWRSTVVPGDGDEWVVRTWLRTPGQDSRPTGAPDVVHRVRVGGGGPQVRQVHPVPGD